MGTEAGHGRGEGLGRTRLIPCGAQELGFDIRAMGSKEVMRAD